MTLQRNRLAFHQVEEGDFVVGAGQKYITIKLVDVDDVCVLIGMEFTHEL